MLPYLLFGASLGFSAAVQPGPFLAYLIGQSLRLGWRKALPAVLAPLISDGPIVAAMLLLLTQLPGGFLRFLQVAGGLYVLFLAWKAFRAWRGLPAAGSAPAVGAPAADAPRQSVLQAALVNALSPGPYIFWSMIAGPVVIRGWNEAPVRGAAFMIGFYAVMLGSLTALAVIFGAAGRLSPRANRVMMGLSALALAAFGAYQLLNGIIGA